MENPLSSSGFRAGEGSDPLRAGGCARPVAPEDGTGVSSEVYPVEFVYEAPKEHSLGRAVGYRLNAEIGLPHIIA